MAAGAAAVGAVLLEARPFRPFKSSEEYVYAMKEDLAEWLSSLYPELRFTADNLLHRLDSGVALCRHANAVRESARRLLERGERAESEHALQLARALVARPVVSLLPAAQPATFFARDNLCNFIDWCRRSLGVLECLLFETDDLCLRKNEKHVVLCLLEVARRGAELGMPAPLLVQMEREIDRELAGQVSVHTIGLAAPQQQVVTNDLRSLDERVRELLARCCCPTQFPMVRVSEGKYRIGDTKILIFVRILRSHVMVRVGGGWDTLQHYLDKHDPCRCRTAHRAARAARLQPARTQPGADIAGATVTYEREPAQSLAATSSAARPPPSPTPSPSRGVARAESPARGSTSPERRVVLGGVGGGVTRASGLVASPHLVPTPNSPRRRSPRPVSPHLASPRPASPPLPVSESASDNGSELSDEGYRSLGVLASPPSTHPECGEETEPVSASTGLRRTNYSHTLYGAHPSPTPPPPPHPHLPRRAHTTPPHHNTWSGRNTRKSRPAVSADTFSPPGRATSPGATLHATTDAAAADASPLCRGSLFRASCSALRAPSAAAATAAAPAPSRTPLLQHILRSTQQAHDDAAVLKQVKRIIRQYSGGDGFDGPDGSEAENAPGSCVGSDSESADMTHAWVCGGRASPRRDRTRRVAPTRIPAPTRVRSAR